MDMPPLPKEMVSQEAQRQEALRLEAEQEKQQKMLEEMLKDQLLQQDQEQEVEGLLELQLLQQDQVLKQVLQVPQQLVVLEETLDLQRLLSNLLEQELQLKYKTN
jgi:hypothetical protein